MVAAGLETRFVTQAVTTVTLGGVIASVFVSYLLSQRQLHAQLDSLRYQVEQGFTEKLFEKRIEVYPEMYGILSAFSKQAVADGVNKKALDEFADRLNDWDSRNAIFCSAYTVRQMLELAAERAGLDQLADPGDAMR